MKRIAPIRPSLRRLVGLRVVAMTWAICCGCSSDDVGLEGVAALDATAPGAAGLADAASPPDGGSLTALDGFGFDVPALLIDPPPGVAGPPAELGCADGTREGFVDATAWKRIAGCAGAWTVPGLQSTATRLPQCGRGAGNSGINADGFGCSVADLCAEGWHVCEGPDDVSDNSATDCESAAAPGYASFFVVRVGASPYGLCTPDPTLANDLHGCGSYGAPEFNGCQPLDRRLGFLDCMASGGIWSCGDAVTHLEEGRMVTKSSAALGGVLCCRDPG